MMDVIIKLFKAIVLSTIIYCGIAFINTIIRKSKWKEELYYQTSSSWMDFYIACIVLAIAYAFGKFSIAQIDFSFFVNIVTAFIVALLAIIFRGWLLNKVEDYAKLTSNYESILKKYDENNWYTFDNSKIDNKPKKIKEITIFPDIVDIELIGKEIKIDDSQNMYEIPEEIKAFESQLYKAHDTSHVYNQLNIRVDDWFEENNVVTFKTSRTTYFKSLVTNRALDYKVEEQKTVRELLLYGPFLPTLKESKLSNHLGFNGFIITRDGYIPLVLRNKNLSIGKNSYGASIAASMKTKYCLNEEKIFTIERMCNAILMEIKDEIKVDPDDIIFDYKTNILCAYREGYEGTKPQLLFYAKTCKSKDEIYKKFKKEAKKQNIRTIEEIELEDGNKILWINTKDIEKIAIGLNCFSIYGKKYKSSIPSLISLAIFINYIKENKVDISEN